MITPSVCGNEDYNYWEWKEIWVCVCVRALVLNATTTANLVESQILVDYKICWLVVVFLFVCLPNKPFLLTAKLDMWHKITELI